MFTRNRLMVQIGSFGEARCEARCGASGKRCNVADGPIWTTEGRVFTPSDCVTAHLWSARPRREPCLASRRENPVKLIPYEREAIYFPVRLVAGTASMQWQGRYRLAGMVRVCREDPILQQPPHGRRFGVSPRQLMICHKITNWASAPAVNTRTTEAVTKLKKMR